MDTYVIELPDSGFSNYTKRPVHHAEIIKYFKQFLLTSKHVIRTIKKRLIEMYSISMYKAPMAGDV